MTETVNQQGTASDELVRKIQLLLNLGQRSEGNETEAAAAMAKAQELLTKYNLDLATVQDKSVGGGPSASAADAKREKIEGKRNATYEWSRRLVEAIATANYCMYWTADVAVESKSGRTRYVKRHRVLGRIENTTAVLVMTDYLYETIMRLLPYDKSSWLSKDAMAWCDGCVDRLIERIEGKTKAMRTPDYASQGEQGYSTAIMVRSMAEAEAAANYDAINGKGAWARHLAREAEYQAASTARAAKWAEQEALLEAERKARLLAETPADKVKREKAEERERAADEKANRAWSRRYWARQDREQEKKNSDAYRSGRKTGDSVGLDSQLGTKKDKVLGN